jgi:tetratricopeptide (TPR) repeat protein
MRTGQLLAAGLARFSRRAQPAEWGGMGMFVEQAVPGDDPRLETVHRNFEANLRDIVRIAEGAGAKVLLSTVVANLKDCPPLLSRHRPGLAGDELARWQSAYDRGRIAWRLDDPATARPHLEEARRLDPQYADTLFLLGDLELHAGDTTAARQLFAEALRWDALRFRPDPRINDIIRRIAADYTAVRLVDTARLLGADPASEAPIAGRELLFEHVHFDWEGNHRVARILAEGAETLLGPPPAGAPAWLDSAATAAAIGYTERERAGVLQKIGPLLQSPPFPNQLTYPEDMARFARESARAQAAARDPAIQRRARETVATAVARDPDNPFLAKIEDEIADDLGDLPAALAAAEHARRLQPDNYAVAGNVAIKLARLGRLNEAETLLRSTAARSPVSERIALLPAFADLHTRMEAPEKHRALLDQLHALRPGDTNLLLARARWAESQGDTAAAERELRATLARDPGQQMALETLVGLLARINPAVAAQATLDFADRQTRNHANNLRAALLAEQRNDREAQIRFLLAAERSGPVPAGLQIRLARLLIERNQPVGALGHLAEARRIALAEGDNETRAAVEQYIRQMRGGGP